MEGKRTESKVWALASTLQLQGKEWRGSLVINRESEHMGHQEGETGSIARRGVRYVDPISTLHGTATTKKREKHRSADASDVEKQDTSRHRVKLVDV